MATIVEAAVSPIQHVRLSLATAKQEGEDFCVAWNQAITSLPHDDDPEAHEAAFQALVATIGSWYRAYMGEAPSSGEVAAAELAGMLEPEPLSIF